MFGLLLVEDEKGERGLLRAFSGRWQGSFHHLGWVPPVFEFETTPGEVETKKRLSDIKVEMEKLQADERWQKLEMAENAWASRLGELKESLRSNKQARDEKREQGVEEAVLQAESRADKRARRELKKRMEETVAPLRMKVGELERRVLELKRTRKTLSRTLQAEMHEAFSQNLWHERPWSVASLFPSGPPTGVGECCAPKLLHFAQSRNLVPIAMAEIWWGGNTPDRRSGEFYPACVERCRPLLGALFSSAKMNYDPLFEDEHIVVVDKPTGVLSVPGRQLWNQDSVLNRWSRQLGELYPVHRLDMETSGVLMMAKTPSAQAKFQKLFSRREVEKDYQALLERPISSVAGELDLSLARDGERPGCYLLDENGKSALTLFELLDEEERRVLFTPHTGRSHQLRVHAAQGLSSPIRGDRLYGSGGEERLKLHAWKLRLQHPFTKTHLSFEAGVPF